MAAHIWKPSPYGHGLMVCEKCLITMMEACALGVMNDCPPPFAETIMASKTPTPPVKGEKP